MGRIPPQQHCDVLMALEAASRYPFSYCPRVPWASVQSTAITRAHQQPPDEEVRRVPSRACDDSESKEEMLFFFKTNPASRLDCCRIFYSELLH